MVDPTSDMKGVLWADDESHWVGLGGDPVQPLLPTPGETRGDQGVSTMILPRWLDELQSKLHLVWESDAPTRIEARWIEESMLAPRISTIGMDYYLCTYDRSIDVVADFSGYIDGRVALRSSLRSVSTLGNYPGT